jgi:TRAP-type uncharacterized transport system fused permease subunit
VRTIVRLGTLFACCLWGATAGWAAALAVARPEPPPGPTLLAYGALALFCAGYLLGSWIRGRAPSPLALRAAVLTAAAALTAKALAPGLAAWVAVLIAAAVFGVLCGLVRTRGAGPTGGAARR